MLEPARFPAAILVAAFLAAAAYPAYPATSPEDFVKDKNAPSGAQAPANGAAPAPESGTPAAAPKAAKPAKTGKSAQIPPMDTAKIHEQYLEGDFDHAIRALESQLKSQRPMSHAESVFVFKHLGVMYAAQQSTREKGKHYMQSLIAIEPTAKILDMYASDMIHLIFRNVQEEFEAKRRRLMPSPDSTATASAGPEPGPAPAPSPAPLAASPKKDSGTRKTVFLAAAGASVAVGALALFFLLGEDEDPKVRTIEVSE
jgi:hypothetical protein